MGMQCHFSNLDLPDGIQVDANIDQESQTWTATILFSEGPIIASMSHRVNDPDIDYSFDVGHGTKGQLLMLQTLIRNRVCFTCS